VSTARRTCKSTIEIHCYSSFSLLSGLAGGSILIHITRATLFFPLSFFLISVGVGLLHMFILFSLCTTPRRFLL